MVTLSDLAIVLFVVIAVYFLRKLYMEAMQAYKELSGGIRDVRKKSSELCAQTKVFLENEESRKKLRDAATDILAEGISRGLHGAYQKIKKRKG